MIKYEETDPFQKDFKKLLKRFRTLHEDLTTLKKYTIELFHLEKINNNSIFPMNRYCSNEILICKIKKFACKSLKGRGAHSGLRLIYAFHIKSLKVELIEIYFKADKEKEDQDRIKNYISETITVDAIT